MGILLPVLVCAFVICVVYAIYATVEERNDGVNGRLRSLAALPGRGFSERERALADPLVTRAVRLVLNRFSQLVARLTPQEQREKLRNQIQLAGAPGGLQIVDFLAVKGIMAFGLPICTYFLLKGAIPDQALMAALAAGIGGYVAPDFLLKKAVQDRQRDIQKALPDVLDLLTVSMEAGLGFDSALAKVVEKMSGPLAQEFGRTLQDMRLGKPRRNALRDLADRIKVDDFSTFVTALVQADQLGVSIGKVLRVQSVQMRTKRRQRAEELALKAPVKMLFPLIIFIFPTIFIILLGPAAIRIMATLTTL